MPQQYRISSLILLILLIVSSLPRSGWLLWASAFPLSPFHGRSIFISAVYQQKEQQDDNPTMNPITRASWYAAEALGSIFGRFSSSKPIDDEPPRGLKYRPSLDPTSIKQQVNILIPPSTMDETLTRIQYDNDRCYFLSGQVDALIYDPNCLFADPFVSFRGRDRFINNLKNLNTFITRYDAKLISLNSSKGEDPSSSFQVETKIMVKLELNLPWKPILAWPWGVTYQIDPTSNLVVVHRESWDIEPWEGVLQVFRKPTTTIS